MVIEEGAARLLTDPGSFTVEVQDTQTGLDAIVITHEHQDHFHIDSVKKLLETNPGVRVITNSAVAALLQKEGIAAEVVGDGQSGEVKGVPIEGYGKDHAPIYGTMGLVENTGYFIGGRLYFPGDNFHNPNKQLDVLALPVAGPWMKMSEAIDFVKLLKPRIAFGVHDGMITPSFRGFVGMALKMFAAGVEYVSLQDGESREF